MQPCWPSEPGNPGVFPRAAAAKASVPNVYISSFQGDNGDLELTIGRRLQSDGFPGLWEGL